MSIDIAVENFKIANERNKKMKNSTCRVSDKERKQLEEKMEREWEYWKHRSSNKRK